MFRTILTNIHKCKLLLGELKVSPRRLFMHARRTPIHAPFNSDNRSKPFSLTRGLVSSPGPSVEGERMVIGFTCKVCNQRTHRFMSKLAYTRGVVLIECPGCQSRHLIADHLGWFDRTREEGRTIEEILAQRGEQVRKSWSTDLDGTNILEVVEDADKH